MNKLLLLLSFGFGAVITVPDEFSTIQAGIDAAAIGDTVVVYPDLYNENIIRMSVHVLYASYPPLDCPLVGLH